MSQRLDNRKKRLAEVEMQHLARLARIKLSKKEQKSFSKQLSNILHYFRKIDEASTEGVCPTYHVLELTNVWRSDEVETSSSKEILKNVPLMEGRYIKGPRMG